MQYQTLGRLRTAYPGVPIMALTATAHKNNVDDIIAQLNIGGCVRLAQSFNRPNLRYAVKRKAKPWGKQMDEMVDVIKRHAGETGIIYCLARVKCEEVAKQLRDRGISAKHYHAGMSPEDKTQTQKAWQDGTCKIIVATVRFAFSAVRLARPHRGTAACRSRSAWASTRRMVSGSGSVFNSRFDESSPIRYPPHDAKVLGRVRITQSGCPRR